MGKKRAKKKHPKKKWTAKKQPIRKVEVLSKYDQWITWLCYAILVLLPLMFSRISYDQFDLVKLAIFRILVAVAVLVWIAKMLKRPAPIIWSWREGLLVGFLAIAVISAFTSIHIPTTLHGKYKRYEGLLTFITYMTIYFVAMQSFRDKKQIRTLIEVISITGGLVAFYGILQYVGMDPIGWGNVPFEERRSFSTFGNPDLLAGYLVLALPCAIVAFFDNNKRRWLHGLAAFLLASGLLTAFTRSGWLGALVALIMITILLGRHLITHWRKIAIVSSAFGLVFAALLVYSATSDTLNLVSKFQGAFQLTSGTALSRFEIWKGGFKMIEDRPFLGQGLGTYRLASEHFETKRYVQSVAGTTVSDNAHNYIVQLAAGAGPVAALLIYAFFIAWIIRTIKVRRALAVDSSERLMITGAIAAITGYLATMMLGISIVGAGSTFWLLMAATAGYTRRIEPRYRSFDVSVGFQEAKLAVSVVVVIISMVSAGFAVTMYIGDIYFVNGIISAARGQQDLAVNQFNRAISLYPGNGRIMSELGQANTRWATAALQRRENENFRQYAENAVVAFERAEKAEPPEVDYKVFLANAHAYLGHTDQAVGILQDVLEYRPHSVPAHFLFGTFKEQLNQKAEAIKHYEAVVSLAPSYTNAVSALARLYKETDNVKKAVFYDKKLKDIKAKEVQ